MSKYPAKNTQKSKQNGRDLKPPTLGSGQRVKNTSKKEGEAPKTPDGSVEVIKAKAQISIEKGGSLLSVEAKFISSVSCFWRTDQAIQDLRKCPLLALGPALRRRPSEKE